MEIDWSSFSPYSALAGGLLIGLAAALYLLGAGRIAGIAGIIAQPVEAMLARRSVQTERSSLLFLVGLLLAPTIWRLVAELPAAEVSTGSALLLVAGLMVGFGARLGNGCTSGHGICGLSRFSSRSLVNVLCFMGSGFLTLFVLRHAIGA